MLDIQKTANLLSIFILLLSIGACGGSSSNSEPNPPLPPVLSSDATLSALSLSAGELEPAFSSENINYVLSTFSDSTTVTPTVNQANATVSVNGEAISSGVEGSEIPLSVGDNIISILVTAEDGTTSQTYSVVVSRTEPSNDANLSGLTFSAGAISPAFDSDAINYTLATTADFTRVTATLNQNNASIMINGLAVNSGEESDSIALEVGTTTINVLVTAEDGVTNKMYAVIVSRSIVPPLSNDATLSQLSLSAGVIDPVFSPSNFNYVLSTVNSSTTVTSTVNQANATVTVNGDAVVSGTASSSIPLVVGNTSITIVVTAEDGVSNNTYNIEVTRQSADASLSFLTLSAGVIDPVFSSSNSNYTLTTISDSTTVMPVVNQSNATITVNGVPVVSGTASAPISLSLGSTSISIVVTAQDGNTTQTYNVLVNRQSADATLLALSISAGAINPAFAADITSYSLSTSDNSTTITPVVNQASATVVVNGVMVDSGAATDVISLNLGENSLNVVVTAEDSTTSVTYEIVVTRQPSTEARLSSLTLSAGLISPAFSGNTFTYTSTTTDTFTTVTASVRQNDANFMVNGFTGTSGSSSLPIQLPLGNTTINVEVTAQDGSTMRSYSITINRVLGTFDLIDPTPGASDLFGQEVIQLPNGNIVVTDPNDSSVANKNGAVHLYNPLFSNPIASLYGDEPDDQFGGREQTNRAVIALSNSNYLIIAGNDDVAGVVDAGSVRLMNGATGAQIAIFLGDEIFDVVSTRIEDLGNNNFVMSMFGKSINGITDAGTVQLINSTNGAQIGATLAGDNNSDFLGTIITGLANGNYIVSSQNDDVAGIVDAGSIRVFDGTTGAQIGTTIAGDDASDRFGSKSPTELPNGNYVLATNRDNIGGIVNAGSIRLIDGITGLQIGATIEGDEDFEYIGTSITVLANNNFVIISDDENDSGIEGAGSIRLVDGANGTLINFRAGNNTDDQLGFNFNRFPTVLANNNYVITSVHDDVNGVVDAGSVRLFNGDTGIQIDRREGDVEDDSLGNRGIFALGNNNYVIASGDDDVNGIVDAGSVRLINGIDGTQINRLEGDVTDDSLGRSGIAVLANNNFVIASSLDDEGGITNAGSVRLVSGTNGVQIGPTLAGDTASDSLGNGDVTPLGNNTYVVLSDREDENGIIDAGTVRLMDGATGLQIGATLVGDATDDFRSVSNARSFVLKLDSNLYYILSQPGADNAGQVDAGRVRVVVP